MLRAENEAKGSKESYMRLFRDIVPLLILGAVALTGTGCATHVRIRVLEPAQVSVPHHIQTLAVIDRSHASGTGQLILGVLEAGLTGEQIGVDRSGREEAVRGVVEVLSASPRFTVIQPLTNPAYVEPDLFGRELSWPTAQRLCQRAGCQGIVSLELFDSDSRLTYDTTTEETTDDKGKTVKRTVHIVDRDTDVQAMWRLYDATGTLLIDSFTTGRLQDSQRESAESRSAAETRLNDLAGIVSHMGRSLGQEYGRRIAPTYVFVSRALYGRGDPMLKEARTRVNAGDWKGARALWDQLATASDPDVRGRANYNLALALEVEGELDAALELVRKAATDVNKGRVRRYIEILQFRIADRARLQQQMAAPPAPPAPPPPGQPVPPPPRTR